MISSFTINGSFNSYSPLVWIGCMTGKSFELITDAYPDWKVLAIPGFVVTPAVLNFNIHWVPAM